MAVGRDVRRAWTSFSEALTDRLPEGVRHRLPVPTSVTPLRLGALTGAAALIMAFVALLVDIVTVIAAPDGVIWLAAGAALLATALSRSIRPKAALGIGVVGLGIGLIVYFISTNVVFDPLGLYDDTVGLLTGQSVLQLQQLRLWALAVTPAPVFLTWYLAVRGRYGLSAFVGSSALGFFVLTGDAGTTTTLVAVIAAAVTVGLGDLSESDRTVRSIEILAPVVAVMVVAPLVVSVVPVAAVGGSGLGELTGPIGSEPESLVDGESDDTESNEQRELASEIIGDGDRTMAGAVVDSRDELQVVGSVSLWPEVQFVVQADRGQYWRTNSYDRYTGDGWVRTDANADEAAFRPAEGPTDRVNQTVRAETEMNAMPAAFRPVAVESESIDDDAITTGASLSPDRPLRSDETYTVTSTVPDSDSETLRDAGTEYPEAIEDGYTQLPNDVPERVSEATAELTADTDNPYETAVTIERYLRTNKEYSLTVDRPEGDIADAFLFEMDAGYCTYFATTMVVMLRSQNIPARMATGYSTGQQIDDDTWVVRGSNAHAWVEVYFPDHGWIAFEPTPSSDLEETQAESLTEVREAAEELDEQSLFDTDESLDVSADGLSQSGVNETDLAGRESAENETETQLRPSGVYANQTSDPVAAGAEAVDAEAVEEDDAVGSVPLPVSPRSGEEIALLLLVVLGAVAGVRRSSLVRRAIDSVRIRYQRRRDPETDINRAFERTMTTLELRYRSRKRGETVREYLNAVDPDPRARRVVWIYERARYRGEASATAADEAVQSVEELIADR